jgi:hypothetical protein
MVGPILIMIFMPEASGITCLVHHESQLRVVEIYILYRIITDLQYISDIR